MGWVYALGNVGAGYYSARVLDDAIWPDIDLAVWGKERDLSAPYPLVCHLLDAAAMAAVLWDGYLTPGQRAAIAGGLGFSESAARQFVVLCAGLHDIGKAVPYFQHGTPAGVEALRHLPGPSGSPLGHAEAVHRWLAAALTSVGYECENPRTGTPAVRVAQLLGGHHGRFFPCTVADVPRAAYDASFGGQSWEAVRQRLLQVVWEVADRPPAPKAVSAPASVLVCGVVMLADWLVSQAEIIERRLTARPTTGSRSELFGHFVSMLGQGPDLLAQAGLEPLVLRSGTFAVDFPHIDKPYEVQASIAQALPALVSGPGLLLVMAPMGEGKTEIALHAARLMGAAAGAGGLLDLLPTMATAEEAHERVADYILSRASTPRSVTLLHGMAALHPLYGDMAVDDERWRVLTDDDAITTIVPTAWLHGSRRGILARGGVGTVDQGLMTVLPLRYGALRLLGMTGKTVIIDEAHAYDKYMQGLLARLLSWLGYFGVPVVLLSATLPKEVARNLIEAYLEGALPPGGPLAIEDVAIDYPGWVYANGSTGQLTTQAVNARARDIALTVHPHSGQGRGEVLRTLLAPLVDDRGCALLVCTTVAEAQQTYLHLAEWFKELGEQAPELALLHARFPAGVRRKITDEVRRRLGRDGTQRPLRYVLVATAVVEQALDLDFDIVLSDLAPVAQLLQRVGRCHRHERDPMVRGPFASGPQLSVLAPVGSDGVLRLPEDWTLVYERSLLCRTWDLLQSREGGIAVPGDVQELVDAVYEVNFGQMGQADFERLGRDEVMTQLATMVAVSEPHSFADLYRMSHVDVDDDLIATRMGADRVLLLPCYRDADGTLFFDSECRRALPTHGKPTRDHVIEILDGTVPVRAGMWLKRRGPETNPPPAWAKNIWLKDLILVPHAVVEGIPRVVRIGPKEVCLDSRVGLVVGSTTPI